MLDCLLLVPPFWDPVCVPLGVSSLNAYLKTNGLASDVYDYNVDPQLFGIQKRYFDAIKSIFPFWNDWNIERNGTEMFALHQLAHLRARTGEVRVDLIRQILDVTGDGVCRVKCSAFEPLLDEIFERVRATTLRLLHHHKPRVVGLSLYNSNWASVALVCEIAKRFDPSITTVVGGPGPVMGIASSADQIAGFLETNPAIDHYVIGEGERALLDLVTSQSPSPRILGGIRATLRLPSSKDRGLSLHSLPDPDYGSLDPLSYLNLSIATSRGCPYECSFCAETIFWQGFRSSRHSDVLQRFDNLAVRYGKTQFYICDSLSNHVIAALTEATLGLSRPYTYDCYLRADASCGDDAAAKLWHKGGLRRARLGMESASQRILDDMVKKTDVGKMSRSLDALAGASIATSTLWIIGYPGETEVEFEDTLRFIADHRLLIYQADAWLFQFSPFGLSGSARFSDSGLRQRFSDEMEDISGFQFHLPRDSISTKERFNRLRRFVHHIRRLDVPNPYSLAGLRVANLRWKLLHSKSGGG